MIKVVQPGLLTTVQDEGRTDFLAFGMPRAGVMDRYAARMANLLCGNPLGAAVLEMTVIGGSYRFLVAARIAVCGANMPLSLNGETVSAWGAVDVRPEDVLEIGAADTGCRAYLAVAGGIEVPLVMSSRSTYYRAGIGGFAGRALKADDELPIGNPMPIFAAPIRLPAAWIPEYSEQIEVRILPGPQRHLFSASGWKTLLSTRYTVTDEADRMGYRLDGEKVEHLNGPDIVSDALTPGAIQVPGSGQPIIMMADCGTTGGYAKIATVIGSDLAKIGQAKPQDYLSFIECSYEEAVAALGEEMERYRQVAEWTARGKTPQLVDVGSTNILPNQSEQLTSQQENSPVRRLTLSIDGKNYKVEIEEVM